MVDSKITKYIYKLKLEPVNSNKFGLYLSKLNFWHAQIGGETNGYEILHIQEFNQTNLSEILKNFIDNKFKKNDKFKDFFILLHTSLNRGTLFELKTPAEKKLTVNEFADIRSQMIRWIYEWALCYRGRDNIRTIIEKLFAADKTIKIYYETPFQFKDSTELTELDKQNIENLPGEYHFNKISSYYQFGPLKPTDHKPTCAL